jgi:hypothetical protein
VAVLSEFVEKSAAEKYATEKFVAERFYDSEKLMGKKVQAPTFRLIPNVMEG